MTNTVWLNGGRVRENAGEAAAKSLIARIESEKRVPLAGPGIALFDFSMACSRIKVSPHGTAAKI